MRPSVDREPIDTWDAHEWMYPVKRGHRDVFLLCRGRGHQGFLPGDEAPKAVTSCPWAVLNGNDRKGR